MAHDDGMDIDEQPVSVAYMAAVDLALALGFREIGTLPGAWVHRVDDDWTVAISGKLESVKVEPEGCMPVVLEPFHMIAWWRGLAAGFLVPSGGTILVFGDGRASEDNLIAALEAARRAA